MIVAINRLILLCLVVLLSTVQSLAQQEGVFKKFAGTYVSGHEFGGGSVTLDTDGHFSDVVGSDDGTQTSTSGTYTFSDGRLHFIIVKSMGRRGGDGKEYNLLDPQSRKEMYRDMDGGKIEKEFEMLPMEWSGRIYLLYEEDLKNFANAVNLGIEPRATLISFSYLSPWYGSFYLREGDEQKKVTGNPPLPKQWLSFLLISPVAATIISIDETKKYKFSTTFTATINKGSRDGLKVGMKLLTNDEKPSPWGGTEIVSIAEKTAKIQTSLVRAELKVGDKISSRYESKIPYK